MEEAHHSNKSNEGFQQLKWVLTLNENASKKGIKRALSSPDKSHNILTPKARTWSDLSEKEGLTGFFTKEEDEILKKHLQDYFASIGSTWEEGIKALVEREAKTRSKHGSVWIKIAEALPQRRVSSIMFRIQSQLYPWIRGKWTDEENEKLVKLYEDYPNDWKRIGFALQRYWRTARDHFKTLEASGKVDQIKKLVLHRSTDIVADGESNPTSKSGVRRKNRAWTDVEDQLLLDTIRQISGVKWPLSNIPWEYISRKLSSQIPGRSREHMRFRYVRNLIPHKEFMLLGNKLIRRQLVRYIRKLLHQHPQLHWSEIDWSACLPFWPGIRCGWTAKQMILDESGHGSYYLYRHKDKTVNAFFESDRWKAFIKPLYKRLMVKEHIKDDMVELEVLLSRLREENGGKVDDWGELPFEGNISGRKEYSKKRKTLNVSREEELMENLLKLDPTLTSDSAT